jgi:hypothetical protein
VTRKRFDTGNQVEVECLQHGHPCSEVGAAERATARRRRFRKADQRNGARAAARVTGRRSAIPNARATCAKDEAAGVSGNWSIDGVSDVQATRAARAARPFGKPGGGDVPLYACTVPPCGFISWETGRRSKAGSAGAPCSEVARVRVGQPKASSDGFMARATHA